MFEFELVRFMAEDGIGIAVLALVFTCPRVYAQC